MNLYLNICKLYLLLFSKIDKFKTSKHSISFKFITFLSSSVTSSRPINNK